MGKKKMSFINHSEKSISAWADFWKDVAEMAYRELTGKKNYLAGRIMSSRIKSSYIIMMKRFYFATCFLL